jgi:hypothetical protein
MRKNGENWVWDNKGDSFNVKMKVKLRSTGSKFQGAKVFLPRAGMNVWQMASGYKTRELEELVTVSIGKTILTAYQNDAANLCSVFGGAKKSVRDLDAKAILSASTGTDLESQKGTFPIKVVCLPVEGPSRTPVELKVTELKLYTIPQRPRCGQPVQLITEIHTNKPGKVEFQLFRRDGEKQNASLVTEKVKGGYAKRWAKKYTYDQSIKREYLVVVKGHEFSSEWVPVEVKCGANADHKRPGALAN